MPFIVLLVFTFAFFEATSRDENPGSHFSNANSPVDLDPSHLGGRKQDAWRMYAGIAVR
jgi:hypothetical protein